MNCVISCQVNRRRSLMISSAIPRASASVKHGVTLGAFVFSDFREIGEKWNETAPHLSEDGDRAKETEACKPYNKCANDERRKSEREKK